MFEIRTRDKYRFLAPSSGRQVILEAEPGVVYNDSRSGEELVPIAKLTPLAPSASNLPWAVENLRFCPHCDQLAQRDLTACPTCGGALEPLATK